MANQTQLSNTKLLGTIAGLKEGSTIQLSTHTELIERVAEVTGGVTLLVRKQCSKTKILVRVSRFIRLTRKADSISWTAEEEHHLGLGGRDLPDRIFKRLSAVRDLARTSLFSPEELQAISAFRRACENRRTSIKLHRSGGAVIQLPTPLIFNLKTGPIRVSRFAVPRTKNYRLFVALPAGSARFECTIDPSILDEMGFETIG